MPFLQCFISTAIDISAGQFACKMECVVSSLNPYGATYQSLTGRIFKDNNTKAGAIIVKFQYIVQNSHYSYYYTLIIVF